MTVPTAESDLDLLCQAAGRLLALLPHPPTMLKLQHGLASAELVWPERPAAPVAVGEAFLVEPGLEPRLEPGDPAPTDTGVVRAPLVGTFYHAPEPGAPPFVVVGSSVEPGEQIAIIESMKLMNPIVAETRGRVVEILVADGTPVEYDQPLIVIASQEERPQRGEI